MANTKLKSEPIQESNNPALGIGGVMQSPLGIIKVCPDPGCEAVWHNCPIKHTKCNDCDGRIMKINEDTFWKKFSNNWFQYDFETGEYFRPVRVEPQLSLDFA